ncbi:MAG TPA: glycosyl transferase, partial [Allocoleopsis sp.]
LAIAGHAPLFYNDTQVIGKLPQQQDAATSQRTRWEHGHLQTMRTQVPTLLKAALMQKRFDLFGMALDLCIPPLSLLVMIWLFLAGLTVIAGTVGASWHSAYLVGLEGILLFLAIFSGWLKFGRRMLPPQTLLAIPLYVLWKIPLYFAFLVRPQTRWVRTERDGASASQSVVKHQ